MALILFNDNPFTYSVNSEAEAVAMAQPSAVKAISVKTPSLTIAVRWILSPHSGLKPSASIVGLVRVP